MKHSIRCLALLLLPSVPRSGAIAHEQTTHGAITMAALRESARFQDALAESRLAEMPLSHDWVRLAMLAGKDIHIPGRSAGDHLIAGSVLEDGVPTPLTGELAQFRSARCLRHFMNRDMEGLFGDGDLGTELHFASAQQWGEWGGDALMENTFTWEHALDQYAQSVLAETFEDRRIAFERCLVAIGCNLHLLQDQFSPAHTRDDPHPGHALGFPFTAEGLLAEFAMGSSLLESEGPFFVNMSENQFDHAIVPLIWAPTHAEYFHKAVNWTANRFFSDDTIFELLERPNSSDVELSDDDTCWYLPSLEADKYALSRSPDIAGTKLAYRWSLVMPSILSRDWSLLGSECDESEGLPQGRESLTVVKSNLRHLIPEATGYSAGLLDHFFRGRLDVDQDENGDLIVTNRSASSGSGLNTLIGGTISIVRREDLRHDLLLRDLGVGTVTAGGYLRIPRGLLWREGSLGAPVATLYLVYDGTIGEERGIVITAFDYVDRDGICDQLCAPFTIAPAGDVDGDGFPDLVEGYYQLPLPFPIPDLPWARIVSPRGCREIAVLPAEHFAAQGIQAGFGASGIGDVDGDGRSDLLLGGSLAGLRSAWLVSGASLQILERVPDPWGSQVEVAGLLGDLDDDGRDEFLIELDRGGAFVASALPFSLRYPIAGEAEFVPDGSGDGRPDLRIRTSSLTYLVSGLDGAAIQLPSSDDQPPYDFVFYGERKPIRDLDGDGLAELFCSDPLDDSMPGIMVLSGRNGDPIWSHEYGDSVDAGWIGDYDGGGDDEAVLTTFSGGTLLYRLISTRDGLDVIEPVSTFTEGMYRTLIGTLIGDLEGDGAPERLFASSKPGCWGIQFGGVEW